MKIATAHDPIEADGLGDGNVFSIATNAKAFEVLSRKVYSDPVAAVIREITCNAADAHKLTGRPISDIEVKLPNYFEQDFWVRDYGPGLSIKDVRGLYTTYFASTKDQSNDMIGGFGIGSKSPFAVADQFTITSWHDGFCSEFVCYKENGAPRINMIRSTPSDEPTGLKVQVAADDVGAWTNAASEFFEWWPEVPSTLQHIVPIFSKLPYKSAHMEGPLAKWYVAPSFSNSYVLMGGVRYQIDKFKVPFFQRLASDWRQRGDGIILVAPLGAVSPAPSREQLNYDAATVAWLDAAADQAITELHADTIATFNALTTLYDARKFCFEHSRKLPYWHIIQDKFKFNGEVPHVRVDFYPKTFSSSTYSRPNYRTTWRTHPGYIEHSFHNTPQPTYLWLSTPANSSHYKRIRDEHPSKGAHSYQLVWGATLAAIQAELDKEGFPPNCLIEFDKALPPLPKPPRAPRSKSPIPRDLRGYPQLPNSRFSFADAQQLLDLSVPSYWVETCEGHYLGATHDIIQFLLRHTTLRITKINGSQLSERAKKGLKQAGWTQITETFLHDQPNSFIDPFINKELLVQSVQQLPALSAYIDALPSNSALRSALAAVRDYVTPAYRGYVDLDTLLPMLSDAQRQYIEDRKKHFTTLLDTAKREVDNFPLLDHMKLTDAVVPAILAYLSP